MGVARPAAGQATALEAHSCSGHHRPAASPDAPAEAVPDQLGVGPARGDGAQRLRCRARCEGHTWWEGAQRQVLPLSETESPAVGTSLHAAVPAPPASPPTCMAAGKSRWPRAASKMSRRTASFFHLSVHLAQAMEQGRRGGSKWARRDARGLGVRRAQKATQAPGGKGEAALGASNALGCRHAAHRRPHTSSAACSSSRASRNCFSASSTCAQGPGGQRVDVFCCLSKPKAARVRSACAPKPSRCPGAQLAAPIPPAAHLPRLQQQREGGLLLHQLPHHKAGGALVLGCTR